MTLWKKGKKKKVFLFHSKISRKVFRKLIFLTKKKKGFF